MATTSQRVGSRRSDGVAWTDDQVRLLVSWQRLAAAAQHAHYQLATKLRGRNLLLGVPTVVCAAVVGTSLFATLNRSESLPVMARATIGTLSVVAAVLAAVQTFLRFAERAERHVQAGDWYSAIKRDVDELLALPSGDRGTPKEVFDRLRKDLNKAGQTYPAIGERTWHGFAKAYGVDQPTLAMESTGEASPTGVPATADRPTRRTT
jgi:hypothetical protein